MRFRLEYAVYNYKCLIIKLKQLSILKVGKGEFSVLNPDLILECRGFSIHLFFLTTYFNK